MKFLFFLLLPIQFLFSQSDKKSGYVIYQVSLTEGYFYSDEFKKDFMEGYKESITRDSLMNSVELGVKFSENKSKSFRLKEFNPNSIEYEAIYKANGIANYSYDSEKGISVIEMEYWLKEISISVNLNDKWNINYRKTKMIDGYKCYYAEYKGEGLWWELNPEKPTYAWFTTEIPLPFGPLHYNGLPGLILELNVENVRYTATKIAFDETYNAILNTKDFSKYEPMTEQEFIRERANIRKRAKRIYTGG